MDPFVVLAAASQVAKTIKLGTGVLLVCFAGFRHHAWRQTPRWRRIRTFSPPHDEFVPLAKGDAPER